MLSSHIYIDKVWFGVAAWWGLVRLVDLILGEVSRYYLLGR